MSPTSDELSRATERLERLAPGYLTQVRSAARALAVTEGPLGRIRDELMGLRERSDIDVDAPTAERHFAKRWFKRAVKRSTGWYMFYLSTQLTEVVQGMSLLGDALIEHLERMDGRIANLEAQIERLEHSHPDARVESMTISVARRAPVSLNE